ncbi:MAG TPA: hypothetical protein VNE40_01055 [Candidatus Dormibacteraeota bacterium]|nr:hypothetical protein [Candidatus Dormibacteraeota bacterium]
MNAFTHINQSARKFILFGVTTFAVLTAGFLAINSAQAASPVDCNNNAVIYCGATTISSLINKYDNGDGHNSTVSIHNILDSNRTPGQFNITSQDIHNMAKEPSGTEVFAGSVTKSGDVFISGKSQPVATDAITAGRQDISGSTKETNNGTTFYVRPPSVSFVTSPLSAFVVEKDHVFQFAIIESCGNPVHAKPTVAPKPNYTINKEVAVKGSTNYAKSVKVKPGTHVVYRITVTSTGNAAVTYLKVRDVLSGRANYVRNSLKRDGVLASSPEFFGSGIFVGTLEPGKTTTFTYEAIIGQSDTLESCVAETVPNVSLMNASALPGEESSATVNKYCLPKPVFACVSLTSFPISRSEFDFTAKAIARNGATIEGYDFNFGDGNTKTVTTSSSLTSTRYNYATPGDFKATVSALIGVDGGVKTITAPSCAVNVHVAQAPIAECTNLTLDQSSDNLRNVSAVATFAVQNGAALKNVIFNWGDGTSTSTGTSTTASHTYGQDGTFTVQAILSFTPSSVASSTCQAPITITSLMPTCNSLSLDVNNDDKTVIVNGLDLTPNGATLGYETIDWGDGSPLVVVSDLTGQSHSYSGNGPFVITANAFFLSGNNVVESSNVGCQESISFSITPPTTPPPTTPPSPSTPVPTALVNTGPGSTIGLFSGVTLAAAIAHRWFLSRKLSRQN